MREHLPVGSHAPPRCARVPPRNADPARRAGQVALRAFPSM